MTPQLVISLLPIYVALFIIAYAVLRLYQPRQMVTAPAATGPLIHVKADDIRIDRTTPHFEALEHSAYSNHYRFVERRGDVVMFHRDEYHGPASTWR